MNHERGINPWIAALAAACATIDVVAVGVIPIGRTVVLCGTDWVLTYLTTIAIFSAGSFPLAIVITAIVVVKLVPRARSPWPWFGSTVLLCALAATSVALAARHPTSSDPGMCSL
jgi:hypothetical protein